MGCASSTPMIATAGSDILKAATHAASDAAKGAEHAVEEVTENIGKTLDNAKESVGTAVTGIAHELGNVFTEKTGELDTAKNQLLERLHLGGATKALEHSIEATPNQLDTAALEAAARAPTPPLDLDSLKTSTPEPEIEQAMANSHEDTPPTPKPTIAELEKLTAEVKQTTQSTTAAATATTVTEGHNVEGNRAPAEASSVATAATEPAVDAAAWLAAEKRPGTTDWEKHADHLSKTRKMNEFKGGGKFRRFGPPIAPLNYTKPIESVNMKRALLEDDSCYSDAYYNSQSSPTNSDSPKVRRVRLPINGVLATKAKRMQREFATFVSNRRSAASALRSLTFSPALGRQFDYNAQRVRMPSPAPSLIAYTCSSYSPPPVVINPEDLHNSRTANWKKGLASARLVSPPPLVAPASRAIALLDSPRAGNVIPQTKLTSTKAFAPLRGEKMAGRSRIFGQTRSGSPVNRRVFARRSVSPRKDNASARYIRSGSAERKRALIQAKVEAGRKIDAVTQAPKTMIKLEREASVRENKEQSIGKLPEGGFSLSRALSPIRMAAEMHSLPHLRSEAPKIGAKALSLIEVVEQAVERAKNGGLPVEEEVKLAEEDKEIKNQGEGAKHVIKKSVTETGTPKTSKRNERKGHDNKKVEKKNLDDHKNVKSEQTPTEEHRKSEKYSGDRNSTPAKSESNTANSKANSSHSIKQSPCTLRGNSKIKSPASKKENAVTEKYINKNADLRWKSISPSDDIDDSPREKSAVKGRISMSPSKKETLNSNQNEKKRSTWTHSSPENRSYSSGHSAVGKATPNTKRNPQISLAGIEKSSPKPRVTQTENRPLSKGPMKESDKFSSQTEKEQSQSHWTCVSRRNSKVEHTNMIKRYENYIDTSNRSKNSSPSSRQKITDVSIEENEYADQNKIKTPDFQKAPRTPLNRSHDNNCHEKDQHPKARDNISSGHSTTSNKSDKRNIRQPREIHINLSPSNKMMHFESKLQSLKNVDKIQEENLYTKDNQLNNFITNAQRVPNTKNLTHQLTTPSPTKDRIQHTHSSTHNSYNSSPSKSSKSSTSVVICTNLSTPDTEKHGEAELNDELTRALQRAKLREEAREDEVNSLPNSCSLDDNSQNDFEDSLHTNHDSSRTDNEKAADTDMELSYHADVEITSVSSMEELINMLSPEVAYLNLGRSATMATLRATTPIFNAHSAFHSTPHGSPNRQMHRHYSFYHNDGFEKVPFVEGFSSPARSRSPQAPSSPYKIRARCTVCYNKYVIK